MLHNLRSRQKDGGFTLVELLIVIVILGILSAVVVVAVGNISDNAQTNACATDKKALVSAEEAYFASNSVYVSEAGLVSAGRLTEASTLHDITAAGPGTPATWSDYTVTPTAGGPCA